MVSMLGEMGEEEKIMRLRKGNWKCEGRVLCSYYMGLVEGIMSGGSKLCI